MKKLSILCAFCFVLSALAYTSDDLANANSLADQKIITKQTVVSKYALDSKILRQEVISMALKVKGITVPEKYTCKKYFADATKNDWVCGALELAADNGIITKSNKYANPGKNITRAEALAMLMKAGGVSLLTDAELTQFKTQIENLKNNPEMEVPVRSATAEFGTSVGWIQKLMLTAFQKIPEIYAPYASECLCTLEPNRLATRAEVFHFSASTIRIRLELPSPEIDILYDTSKDPRNWITQTPTQDAGFILYSLIPEGDTLTDWKEKIDKLFLYVDTTEEYDIRDVANGWQGRLKENDEKAKVDISIVNNGVILNYTSEVLNEKGILKFLKGTEGVYSLSYMVKLDNHSSEYFKIWKKIVSEAVLN